MIITVLRKYGRITLTMLFFCAFSLSGKTQNLWNKTYIEDRPALLFSSVIKDGEYYYITGVTSDISLNNGLQRAFLGKIDSSTGAIVKYSTFYDSLDKNYAAFHNTLIKNSKGDFVLTGYAGDSLARMFVTKFNSNLDSVKVFDYYTPNTFLFAGMKMIQFTDGNYYITGVKTDSLQNNANVFLMKIDSLGNRIWEKYYNSRIIDYAKSLVVLNNGNLMLGAFRNDDNQTNEHANTWLLEVDTGGVIQRQWFDPNDSTYAAEGLKQTSDGGFIYGAQKKHSQSFSDIYCTATIVKMNSSFQKQWAFSGGNPGMETGFADIEELPDSSFVACGKYNYRSAWIVKLRSSGQVMWDRKYVGIPDTGSENYLTDIDVLPDGSLIAVGQCQFLGHTPPQVGWFLKLDSNGCEIENCLVGIDDRQQTTDNRQIQIYPNPFTKDISITLQTENNHKATFTITDLLGQTIYKSEVRSLAAGYPNTLDLSYLPYGMYLLEVIIDGQRTIKQIIKQ